MGGELNEEPSDSQDLDEARAEAQPDVRLFVRDIMRVLEKPSVAEPSVSPQEVAVSREALLSDPKATVVAFRSLLEQHPAGWWRDIHDLFEKHEHELGILCLEGIEQALPALLARHHSKVDVYVLTLVERAPAEWMPRLLPHVRSYLRQLRETSQSDPSFVMYEPQAKVLGTMLARGQDADVQEFAPWALDQVRGSAQYPSIHRSWRQGQPQILGRPLVEHPERGQMLLARFLKVDQTQAGEMVDAWRESHEENQTGAVERNVRALVELEAQRPSAGTTLFSRYGIAAFARYPSELLVEQYDDLKEGRVRPYGFVLFPRHDHNDAFYQSGQALLGVRGSAFKDTYALRVIEAGDKVDAVKRLRRLMRDTGRGEPISFAIIGGHGTRTDIQFGGFNASGGIDRPDHLHVEDLRDARFGGYKQIFKPGATVILVSCETGQRDGLAQQLSAALDVSVIAPNRPTNIQKIEARVGEDSQPHFTVTYADEEATSQFVAGRSTS